MDKKGSEENPLGTEIFQELAFHEFFLITFFSKAVAGILLKIYAQCFQFN
jgi:hypothetical protein